MSVTVYGASDDLIEVEGDVREEFSPSSDVTDEDGALVVFSSGVVLRVMYSDLGVWRIVPVAGASRVTIDQAPEDDEDNYSDRATLHEDVAWVVCGHEFAKASR